MVPPRKATIVVPSIGSRPRCCSKSPTTASTRTPGYAGRQLGRRRRRSTGSHTSKGTKRSSVPASARPSSRSFVLVDVPEPSSTQAGGARATGDGAGLALEDLRLLAGGVVLGQPGDVVEELRAALVVEPLRRQVLRRGGEARRARRGAAPRPGRPRVRCTSMVQRSPMSVRVMTVLRGRTSGEISSSVQVARTTERSGTSTQPGSSSSGSDATSTPPVARPASRRVLSELPQVVATIVWPSCSSRLRKASARAVALAMTPASASLGGGALRRGRRARGRTATSESLVPSIADGPLPRSPRGAAPRRPGRGSRARSR